MGGGVYSYILTRQHIVHTVNLQWRNEFHVLLFLCFLRGGEGRGGEGRGGEGGIKIFVAKRWRW